ncbi:hypothetical protein POJ06DRAFT_66570 [Lipomyces tetrasporus]|uniref:WD40 repeat-like protein n=1 Tax=Lipomyces tetrasporus TaxID=54092 RepID=A0AAD7QXF5_9ASCO|nr:uncharacterized protein POJ06DRAFT_66570 [Lipomyces tetrasporus]KAJ8103280.1 hypothetical protein POJ06DRAFT_66570 [Lipomyces tetrasporus]
MSLAPVILPFTHWPVAYRHGFDHAPDDLPTPPEAASRESITAVSKIASDTVLTCATVFSSGVVLGLSSGAIEILQWDEPATAGVESIGLSPLSTTAGHRRSPVVALRRVAAKDSEGRSELLISAAENGEILKHSLPSGRVLKSTTVPFRPNGVIPIDTFLLVYGRSTELRILHQTTLEPHIVMAGMLNNWPIPLPLFAERMVTLNDAGDGQHWKIWSKEARVERITSFGAPISFFNHANAHYLIANRLNSMTRANRTTRMSKDSIKIKLGDRDYGAIISVNTVGEILWLVVQVNGWCLYKWEEDKFVEVTQQEFKHIGGAASSDAADDHDRNWFGVWNHAGDLIFAVVETVNGKTICKPQKFAASAKPNGVKTLEMVFSFTTRHAVNRSIVVTPWVVEPKDVVIELFYVEGEIRYRVGNLRTFTWSKAHYPIHRAHHFINQRVLPKSFTPPRPKSDSEHPTAERADKRYEAPSDLQSSSLLPSELPVSTLTTALAAKPLKGPTLGPCNTGTVFAGMLVFGCGLFVNAYSLPRYLLSFDSPDRTIEIQEEGSIVTHLSGVTLSDCSELLIIGTSGGAVYILNSKSWEVSHRIALSGSPVLFSMLLSRTNELIRDMVVIASRDGTVCIVNPPEAKKIFTIPGHFAQIRLLATPKNSNILVVLYEDRYGRVCNLRSGKIENQNKVTIENEEEWEISYAKVRPTIPEDQLIFTDSQYTINGSSTIFLNMYILLTELACTASEISQNGHISPDSRILINAKAVLSSLYSWRSFESLADSDFSPMNGETDESRAVQVDPRRLIELLFLKRFSSMNGDSDALPASAAYAVPAKLGCRGISNTLTVFHAHQDLLQISGEITAMVLLVCTTLGRMLLTVQLSVPAGEQYGDKYALIDAYYSRFVDVLFLSTESIEGQQYKRPWLRGFARFWTSDHCNIRYAARTCLNMRIAQLGVRPKELSLSISRWRVMLPGVASGGGKPLALNILRRRASSTADEYKTSLERVITADGPDFAGNDEVFDDWSDMSGQFSGAPGDEDCEHSMDETTALATIILGNIAIKFPDRISHVAHREIIGALEILLLRSDGPEGGPADGKSTKELQDIAIELVGMGWHIWGDDKYLATEVVVKRLIDFLGADPTPMVSSLSKSSATDIETISGSTATLTSAPGEPVIMDAVTRRHELLESTVIAIANQSINRAVEICSSTIISAPRPQTRIGAVRFMYYVVRQRPEILIDRLFPLVDATIAALDPSSSGVRNKVVNSITALFNALVTTYPVVASHRAQQRLALSMRPDLVLVYDLRSGTQMASLEGAKNHCLEIQFSPEGRHVMGIDRETREVYVWKLGHSFLSMIQSIGGGGPGSMAHHSGVGAHYAAHHNGAAADAAGRDLVYPRFVGKFKGSIQQFVLSDLKERNMMIDVSWKQEKIIEITVNGTRQTFDFTNT